MNWVSVKDTLPKPRRTNKPWDESERVVVLVNRGHGEVYEAFARYLHSEGCGYEWKIEGHGGSRWDEFVTHWTPLPKRPETP